MTKKTMLALTIPLIVMTVCFGFNAAVLDDHARESLDKMVSQLDSLPDYTIHLSGHADSIGSDDYNDKLSEKRALAVKKYLLSKQVDSTKIKFDFYGERKPLVSNTTEENRALNRRVEVTISGQKANAGLPELGLEPVTLSGQAKQDTVKSQRQDSKVVVPVAKKVKKTRRHLVWTGWRTGFHWSTSGR